MAPSKRKASDENQQPQQKRVKRNATSRSSAGSAPASCPETRSAAVKQPQKAIVDPTTAAATPKIINGSTFGGRDLLAETMQRAGVLPTGWTSRRNNRKLLQIELELNIVREGHAKTIDDARKGAKKQRREIELAEEKLGSPYFNGPFEERKFWDAFAEAWESSLVVETTAQRREAFRTGRLRVLQDDE